MTKWTEKRWRSLPTIEMVGYDDNKPVFTGFLIRAGGFAPSIAHDFNRGVGYMQIITSGEVLIEHQA